MEIFELIKWMSKPYALYIEPLPGSVREFFSILFQHRQEILLTGFDDSVHFEPIEHNPADRRSVIVAMSDGLKSLATALFYKDLGYDLFLVHTRESDESVEKVNMIADRLGAPVYIKEPYPLIDRYSYLRSVDYLNNCFRVGISENLPLRFAVGVFSNDLHTNCYFAFSYEFMKGYEKILQDVNPGVEVKMAIPNFDHMMDVFSKHKSYLDMLKDWNS